MFVCLCVGTRQCWKNISCNFNVKKTALVLLGLNLNNHLLDHCSNTSTCKLWFILFSIHDTFCEEYCIQLSSAKSLQRGNVFSETSFTYNIKSRGPKTEPWGTPAFIHEVEDKMSL